MWIIAGILGFAVGLVIGVAIPLAIALSDEEGNVYQDIDRGLKELEGKEHLSIHSQGRLEELNRLKKWLYRL